MCHLISTKSNLYNTPQTVKVADKIYKNVCSSEFKDLIDADDKRRQVYYLDCPNSTHVSYVQANKVVRTEERYHRPLTLQFGDSVYKNVTSKLEIPGKNYATYIIESPTGEYNRVRHYMKSGNILDENKVKSETVKRSLLKPFKKVAQLIH